LIARKDIICYKNVYSDLMSQYQEFQYEYNIKYPKIKLFKIENFTALFDIYEGYHSYIKYNYAEYLCIHNNLIIIKCIIPKGSRYYMNTYEYVSNQIILIEPCQEENM